MPDEDDARKPPPASPDRDGEGLARRLSTLGDDLDRRRSESERRAEEANRSKSGYAQALRLSTDFVAGVLVGAALGWGFDKLFGTSPWGLIVLLLLGFAAGILNALRTAGLVSEPGPRRPKPPSDR